MLEEADAGEIQEQLDQIDQSEGAVYFTDGSVVFSRGASAYVRYMAESEDKMWAEPIDLVADSFTAEQEALRAALADALTLADNIKGQLLK